MTTYIQIGAGAGDRDPSANFIDGPAMNKFCWTWRLHDQYFIKLMNL